MTSIARPTLLETLGVFMQHQMTLVAHRPPFDEEMGMLGRKRFRQLLDAVDSGWLRAASLGRSRNPIKRWRR